MPVLNHRVEGQGPRLVLLHPVGLDLTFWDAVAARLSPKYTVLRVDFPGHGRSPRAPAQHRLEDYADDVHHLLQHLAFGPASIIGLSFGGMVAQHIALRHPEQVETLILCGCSSEFPSQARPSIADRGAAAERGGMANVVDETLKRWFASSFIDSGLAEPVRQRLLTNDVSGWATAWRAIAALDTAPHLNRISVPTLCVAGESDAAITPQMVRAIASRINGAQFVVMRDAPHMMHIEQPAEFAESIATFLQAQPDKIGH